MTIVARCLTAAIDEYDARSRRWHFARLHERRTLERIRMWPCRTGLYRVLQGCTGPVMKLFALRFVRSANAVNYDRRNSLAVIIRRHD